jgi:hypothetical protein
MPRRLVEETNKTPPSINLNRKNIKLMKSIIPLSALVVLAAFVLMGCDQNTPSNSTNTPTTNSSSGAGTNTPPSVNTNTAVGTNQ